MAEKASVSPRPAGRPVSSRRSGRVEEKLQQKIRDKEYYEAHQTYRVLYQRYKAQGKEKEALELLYNGALLLLQHGQLSSGSDLGMLLVEHFKEKKTPVSDELLEKIGNLFGSYAASGRSGAGSASTQPEPMECTTSEPAAGVFEVVPEVDSREALLRAALKWTNLVADEEQWKYGHPKLHKVAAILYWREKQYGKAREHFLYAEQPQEFGNMLVELSTTFGYAGEADLFIAQAVLQLLVLKDRKGGLAVFNTYTRKHPKFKSDNPPYLHHPTLNFVWFLLSACKDHSREVFQCLRANYLPTINRDPSFNEYLDKIGEAWFGLPNQSRPTGSTPGPSGGIFSGLGDTGGLLEGILNSLSSVLPQAAGAAVSAAATGGQGSTTPPQMNFTVPSSTGPTHIHVGTMPAPETGEPPQMGGYIGEIPFPFPGFPANVRFGPPQVNIHFGPPRPSNQAPQRNNQRPRTPQQGPTNTTRATNPLQGNIRLGGPPHSGGNIRFGPPQSGGNIRFGPPQSGGNIRFGPPQSGGNIRFGPPQSGGNIRFGPPQSGGNIRFGPPQSGGNIRFGPPQSGGNIRFGPPQPGQIQVVGIRMEGVPIQVPAGGVMMGGIGGPGGPIITPEQQQLYQQHTQQSSAGTRTGGSSSQNSTGGGNQQQVEPENSQQQPPHNEDMELD